MTLDSLDAATPKVDRGSHIFVTELEIVTEIGKARLYSDWIYSIYPETQTNRVYLREKVSAEVSSWSSLLPEKFADDILNWSIKTFRETLAYDLALKENRVPQGFNADAISQYLYSGDLKSPFRDSPLSDPRMLFEPLPLRPRSNIVEVLNSLDYGHQPLRCQIVKAFQRTASGQNVLSIKAQFVLERLNYKDDCG